MSEVVAGAPEPAVQQGSEPNLGWALAGMSAGAGVIHFAMTPGHAAAGWQEPLGFAAAGWFQLVTAAMVLMGRGSKRLYQVVIAANLAFIGVWVWSRTAGLPFGETPGVAEPVAAIDAACVALQVGVILVSTRLLLARETARRTLLAPALAAVAALGLVTAVITSPNAANHGHGKTLTGLAKLQADIDDTRCDKGFNVPAYWSEARYLGVDTYWGNNPPAVDGAVSADGHAHGGSAGGSGGVTTTTEPDPTSGRGSDGLDELVSATALAATSEVEAAKLVTRLSDASEQDYDAWLWWLRSSGSLAHEHSATATAEDGSGHGGHVGPQPWVAMTDQKQCDTLTKELALARKTAMDLPTVADAKKAGYVLVTGYLPGIAAHFIKYDLIDGTFEITEPEMILYDGKDDDAHVVGLSYYLWHPGDNKPTQGFTGDNDHGHRHIGLCSSPTGVIIGDSTTTVEDCEARGGSKDSGKAGWMSHAWVVPGCESPWGVFSAASPLLDNELGRQSSKDGGNCAGSAVRDRYDMADDAADAPPLGEDAAGAGADTGN